MKKVSVAFIVAALAAFVVIDAGTALAGDPPRIIDFTSSAKGGVVIGINQGSSEGVTPQARGVLVDADGMKSKCEFTVHKVTAKKSFAKVKCTVDEVSANRFVQWLK